jgi:hypothetical protein
MVLMDLTGLAGGRADFFTAAFYAAGLAAGFFAFAALSGAAFASFLDAALVTTDIRSYVPYR